MHGKVPFDEDNSDNWRFRHFKSFIVFCASTGSFDVAFAVFVLVHDAGVQSYVRYVAAAVSLVEASFIALVVALIFFHKGVDSHADMGPYLFLLWAASLSINITYYIGATSSDSLDDNVYIVGVILASLSQLSGLALSIVSRMLHILYLRDPNPKTTRPNRYLQHVHDKALVDRQVSSWKQVFAPWLAAVSSLVIAFLGTVVVFFLESDDFPKTTV
ncbi:hypothetical protein JCM10212_000323 [Sporobolomyces blumeae]